jgi:hypothetical protein
MRPSSVLLAALVLSSAPAFAATNTSHATSPSASKPAAPTASPERKYCIAPDETTTGTRLGVPVCLTKADWDRRGVDIDALTKHL